jgi:hypothetical protein
MLKILYSLALVAGCSLLSSLNYQPTNSSAACFFIDGKGNLLGTLDIKNYSVRVVDRACWDSLNSRSDRMHMLLSDRFSVPIDHYQEGLSSHIMAQTWKTIRAAGGREYKPFLQNKSGHYIYFKPEKFIPASVNALPLQPGTDLYAPVDGVNVPANNNSSAFNGKVFRVPDNVKIVVDENGSPTIPRITDHVFTFLLNIIFTDSYMQAEIPDEGWLELRDVFNRSDLGTVDPEI